MKKIIKTIVVKWTPKGFQKILKKIYYLYLLKKKTTEDEPDLKLIRHLVSQGDQVVDIGANIGIYTKFLSAFVGEGGCVYSIEPIPQTFAILKNNAEQLRLKNVVLLNYAISDKNDLMTMEIPLSSSGTENYYEARIINNSKPNLEGLNEIKIQSQTLDDLFSQQEKHIAFIKCDVEGQELNCLQGAQRLLKNFKPRWLIEVTSNPDSVGTSAFALFQFMLNGGYEAYWFDGEMLRKRRTGDRSVNYFFLQKKHLESLNGLIPTVL